MFSKIKLSHVVAILIAAAVGGWIITGDFVRGGQANSPNSVPPPAQRENKSAKAFQVRYVTIQPESRIETMIIRGKTSAYSNVSVRAQTIGNVEKRLVEKGDIVKIGDPLCQLEVGVRAANLAQAKAKLAQATFDYNANLKLKKKGYSTDAKLNALKAGVDFAQASLAQMQLDIERTTIVSTSNGIVQDPIAEIGTHLQKGGVCATVINTNPLLFTGQVSERRITNIAVGDIAVVKPISGVSVNGEIQYISSSANPTTRTFSVEIKLPNKDGALRDGLTATASIQLKSTNAYRIIPSWLTLNDAGQIGVRAVMEKNVVKFYPTKILAQTGRSFWVDGLVPGIKIITIGHDYVQEGQTVTPVLDKDLIEKLLSGNQS